MKENRKIEELILMFVSTATAALKKDPQLSGDGWKVELNNQIDQFIRIIRQCLSNISYVPPELVTRLDMYSAKLIPNPSPSDIMPETQRQDPVPSDFPLARDGTISEMPLVVTVARLLGYTEQEAQEDVAALKKFCTEKVRPLSFLSCIV